MSLLLLLSNPPAPSVPFFECYNGVVNFCQPCVGEVTCTQNETGVVTFELQENGEV